MLKGKQRLASKDWLARAMYTPTSERSHDTLATCVVFPVVKHYLLHLCWKLRDVSGQQVWCEDQWFVANNTFFLLSLFFLIEIHVDLSVIQSCHFLLL